VDLESKPPKKFMGKVSMEQILKSKSHDYKMYQIMQTDAHYVYEHTNMIEVLRIMKEQNYERVPVLNRDECVVGYINRNSILNVVQDVMPEVDYIDTVPATEVLSHE
jgi:Mg/Co/Ni transporter MgtE